MADSVVASSASLSDRGERLQADIPSPDGDFAATTAISQSSDAITSLPIELTLSIFECLNPLAVWTLRSVSRAWHSRLAAREFEQNAVSRWNTHKDSDRVRPAQPRTLTDEIRHMQALQTGRPFSFVTYLFPLTWELYLQGRYLAYRCNKNDDGVTVHDLSTGATDTYTDEMKRSPHDDVILTSTLVAFATEVGDWLYWKQLDDLRPDIQRIRLPSVNIVRAAGDGDCIVLLVSPDPDLKVRDSVTQMMIFDASTLQLRSVDLDPEWVERLPESHPSEWQMLVHSQRGLVDIFSAPEELGGADTPINHTRFGHDGSIVKETDVDCQHGVFKKSLDLALLRPRKIGIEDLYRLRLHDGVDTLKGHVLFDARRGEFVDDMPYLPMPAAECAVWKGSVYCSAVPEESNADGTGARSLGDHVEQSDLKPLQRYRRLGRRSFGSDREPESHEFLQFEMNDSFLVVFDNGECTMPMSVMQVFCFEEHLPLYAGTSTGFWDRKEAT